MGFGLAGSAWRNFGGGSLGRGGGGASVGGVKVTAMDGGSLWILGANSGVETRATIQNATCKAAAPAAAGLCSHQRLRAQISRAMDILIQVPAIPATNILSLRLKQGELATKKAINPWP